MVAFRNTGIEGGYGSLATQNWLLARRRDLQRYAKRTGEKVSLQHATGKGCGPPVKVLPKYKGVTLQHVPVLLQYANAPFVPAKFGTSSKTDTLCRAGLIQCVDPPKRQSSIGEKFGDTYLITKAGREYVQALKSNPERAV